MLCYVMLCYVIIIVQTSEKSITHSRVESGSDDPDNLGHLGHFFGESSGSHPHTKLSGCDPDITFLENSVGIR